MAYLYIINSTIESITDLKTLMADLGAEYLCGDSSNARHCLDISLYSVNKKLIPYVKSSLDNQHLDYVFTGQLLTMPKLTVFDMDSTLIPIEVIDELASFADKKQEVSEITELAMQGHLDFNQSLRQRVSCLKGLDEAVIEKLACTINFNPGVQEFCEYLIENKAKVGIASGGFLPFAEELQKRVGFNYLAANSLEILDGKLSGKVIGTIVNAEEKAKLLAEWRHDLALDSNETMAVGDGANDLLMLEAANLGVAYHAKPKVNQQASAVLKYSSMAALIDLFEFAKINANRSKN